MLAPRFSSLAASVMPGSDPAPAAPSRWSMPPDPLAADTDDAKWTDEDIVYLHWRMLQQVAHLADPDRPLDEKFDTLQWVFTTPEKDRQPFSFVSCLRVVGNSPLSPIPYCGNVDVEDIRDRIRDNLKRWLSASLERYPDWVREAIVTRPNWVRMRLARNPQWINEQLKRINDQGDLFA